MGNCECMVLHLGGTQREGVCNPKPSNGNAATCMVWMYVTLFPFLPRGLLICLSVDNVAKRVVIMCV